MSKNILFLLVGKNSSEHMESDIKLSTCRTTSYITRLLIKHGHNATAYKKDIDEVNYSILDGFKPDIICLQPRADKKLIEWAKKTGALIGMGTGDFIDNKAANNYIKAYDYLSFVAVGGEPYNTWVEIARSIENGECFKNIKGLVYRDGAEIKENGGNCDFDINDLNGLEVILPPGANAAEITTSLGCIGNCSFCSEKLAHKKWQGRDIDGVIAEIKQYADRGYYHIEFADTELEAPDIRLERLTKLCKGIIDLDRPIYYKSMFRPDFSRKATPEVMDLLIKSGLYQTFIGAESGSEEDLKLFNKRCTVQDIKNTVRLFESYGVYTDIGFLMFHPFSTIESLTDNINLLEDLGKADFNTVFTFYRSNVYDRLTMKIKEAGLYHENNNSWSFKENNVWKIFDYVRAYFITMRPTLDRYDQALRLQGWYYYLRKVHAENAEKIEALNAYLRRTESIKQVMSINICIWFKKLLELVKEGFDDKKAISISLSLLNQDFISEITNYLERETKKIDSILGLTDPE